MGTQMASHLVKKGHPLLVYDLNPDAVNNLVDLGAMKANSPAHVAEKCDRIITMLPSNPHVLDVYLGKNGVLSKAKPGCLLIDSSTVDPSTSKEVAEKAESQKCSFLDAPVSGAVPAAKAGSLTFMVGGKESDVKAITDTLLCMGKNVVHCGSVGSGVAAKICNNMMLAISMIGTSETLNLAKKLGLDPKLMTEILNISSGRTWVSEIYNPVPGLMENVPASNDYVGGFQSQLMTKDLYLAQASANRVNAPTPLGSLAYQIYRIMLNNSYHGKDFSSVYKFLEDSEFK